MQKKPLPHNIDREIAVLGGMMINPKKKPVVKSLLFYDDFYKESHQHIFPAILESEDFLSTIDYLKKKGLLEIVGGSDCLANMANDVSTSAGIEGHCRVIKELSQRRKIINQCADTANDAWDETIEIDDTLSRHKNGVRGIQADQRPDYTPNSDLLNSVFKDIEERKASGNRFVGVKTGFKNIDENMYGLEPGTYNIIMARPSVGKTALALNIADNVASLDNGKVLFFSLESNDKALTRRRLSAKSGVYLTRIRTGNVEDSQWPDLIEASNLLAENNLIILDRSKYKTIENLYSMAETLALEYSISLIVVDHLQKLRSKSRFQGRHHEISYISDSLSSLFKELHSPGLVLSQLNRDIEKRTKRQQRPRLSDLKESGDIEQDVDVAIGLHREDKKSEFAEIECLKGRDTGTWKEWLRFDRFIQKFYDCENQYSSYTGTIDMGTI